MSNQKSSKERMKRIAYHRKRFDDFCKKHGIERTRRGSWVVYKGTAGGMSPIVTCGEDVIDYSLASPYHVITASSRQVQGFGRLDSEVFDRFGGACYLNQNAVCDVGIHFCFTPDAARRYGKVVYKLSIPPTAIVCLPYDDIIGGSRHGLKYRKARASHVRVLGKVESDD